MGKKPSRPATRAWRRSAAARTILMRLFPDLQWTVRGSQDKVVVRREQRQPVTDAELREQRIDGADLHSGATGG